MSSKLILACILLGALALIVSCDPMPVPTALSPTGTPTKRIVPVSIAAPTPSPVPIKTSGAVVIGASAMTGKHFNPLWLTSAPQYLVFPLILPALTWFNDKAQPILDLATKVDVNADATVFTFTLPKNAVWSDGVPLTTKDVAFTYKLALSPTIGESAWGNNLSSIKGALEYQRGAAKEITGIKIVDDQTIRFELKESNATFLFNTYLGILPMHLLSTSDSQDIEKHPYFDAPIVTSGPYEFVEYTGSSIRLKKKTNYWGKPVSIAAIEVKLFEQPEAMLAQLASGEIQIAAIPIAESARLRGLANVDVLIAPGIGAHLLYVDARSKEQIAALSKPREQGGKGYTTITKSPKAYLRDKRFRQALAFALDKKSLIQTVVAGEANPLDSPIFGPDWAVNPNLNQYDPNLDRARSLLRESRVTFDAQGTAMWEGKPITLVYLAAANDAARQLGEALQQQLARVGIRLDIRLVPQATLPQAALNGEGDLIYNVGTRLGVDPSASALYFACRAGWAELVMGYCNTKLDDLLNRGLATSKKEERQKIYGEASAILNDEQPALFLFAPNSLVGVNKGLRGVKPSADPNYLTWNVNEWAFQR